MWAQIKTLGPRNTQLEHHPAVGNCRRYRGDHVAARRCGQCREAPCGWVHRTDTVSAVLKACTTTPTHLDIQGPTRRSPIPNSPEVPFEEVCGGRHSLGLIASNRRVERTLSIPGWSPHTPLGIWAAMLSQWQPMQYDFIQRSPLASSVVIGRKGARATTRAPGGGQESR